MLDTPLSARRADTQSRGYNRKQWGEDGEYRIRMALHAELHRHLGGAVVPRIFWRFLIRQNHPLAAQYPTYESFEAFFTRPRASLAEYLELHTLVEEVQRLDTLDYFVS